MPKRIFLSYRQKDSAGQAGRVSDRLIREFGEENIFLDVDSIPPGVDFRKQLTAEVAGCDLLLAVIGPRWLDLRDEQGGRRIDNPNDYVRIEIGAALQRDIPVIPVLVDEARIPRADVLPEDLRELSFRIGRDVRNTSFHADMDRLLGELKTALLNAEARRSPPAQEAAKAPSSGEHTEDTANRGDVAQLIVQLDSDKLKSESVIGQATQTPFALQPVPATSLPKHALEVPEQKPVVNYLAFLSDCLTAIFIWGIASFLGLGFMFLWIIPFIHWFGNLAVLLVTLPLVLMGAVASWFRTTTKHNEVAVVGFLSMIATVSIILIVAITFRLIPDPDAARISDPVGFLLMGVLHVSLTALLLMGRRMARLSLWSERFPTAPSD